MKKKRTMFSFWIKTATEKKEKDIIKRWSVEVRFEKKKGITNEK